MIVIKQLSSSDKRKNTQYEKAQANLILLISRSNKTKLLRKKGVNI
jgi:hypothetical protein